ncbi:MAG TPA: hypothetical protein VFO39_11540 [Candidatus Sulfotelmatobacter sp.]|nr:hypothetical protein [Candidatus Sulfotelmatobacter sp.]
MTKFRLMAIAFLCISAIAIAQDSQFEPGSERPMFARLPATLHSPRNRIEAASTPLQTWNGSFTSNGTTFNYNMVGVPPFPSSSATIPTVVIPIKIVLSNGATFDPATKLTNGNTVTQNTLASPIFTSTVDFKSGGVDMGTTQYIDSFQRANFWDTTGNPSHLLLGTPTVKPEQTLKVPRRSGSTGVVFGFTAGLVDINYFDSQLHTLLTNLGITPNTFPIFLTFDVYLTQNRSCCIGGYHSSTGTTTAPQSYAHATYINHVGAFAQDVSALSHEVGEWADDPLVVNVSGNNTPCGHLEVGDPLEYNANFGAFPYTADGFTYNLQDLVTLPYFGAPPSTSVNKEFSFQGESLTVCQNGS